MSAHEFASAYAYPIWNVPTPDVVGSKFPEETAVPKYVPPIGKPPDNVCVPASMHTSAKAESVTTGSGFTVMVFVALSVHPLALV